MLTDLIPADLAPPAAPSQPEDMRALLRCRGPGDLLVIPLDCALLAPWVLPAVTGMVAAGLLRHHERSALTGYHAIRGAGGRDCVEVTTMLPVDVYRITDAGMRLARSDPPPWL
jgi:hypothetical protein